MTNLSSKFTKLDERVADIGDCLGTLEGKVDGWEDMKERLAGLETRMGAAEANSTWLGEKVEFVQAEVGALNSAVTEQKASNESIQQELLAMDGAVKNMATAQSLQEIQQWAQQELNRLASELAATLGRVASSGGEQGNSVLLNRVQQLQNKLDSSLRSLEDPNRRLASLQVEFDAMKAQLNHVQNQLAGNATSGLAAKSLYRFKQLGGKLEHMQPADTMRQKVAEVLTEQEVIRKPAFNKFQKEYEHRLHGLEEQNAAKVGKEELTRIVELTKRGQSVDWPIDETVVCTNFPIFDGEDEESLTPLLAKITANELGLDPSIITKVKRFPNARGYRDGIVKLRLVDRESKVEFLRRKYRLRHNRDPVISSLYFRSSCTPEQLSTGASLRAIVRASGLQDVLQVSDAG